MWFYNHDRPNMALGGFTQKQHLAKAANDLLLVSTEYGGITTQSPHSGGSDGVFDIARAQDLAAVDLTVPVTPQANTPAVSCIRLETTSN